MLWQALRAVNAAALADCRAQNSSFPWSNYGGEAWAAVPKFGLMGKWEDRSDLFTPLDYWSEAWTHEAKQVGGSKERTPPESFCQCETTVKCT